MITDPIADLLTRIRNAQTVGHRNVRVPFAKLTGHVLEVLRDEGFISGFERVPSEGAPVDDLRIDLRYYQNGRPAISECRRVSRSGRRVYQKTAEITKVRSGIGISVISTSQGVMSDKEARRRKIGGEVMAVVS